MPTPTALIKPEKTKPEKKESGLAFWMQRVIEECDSARSAFAPDPVHDLRVALRRCCSIADGVRPIDPDPAWKDMKKEGKRLFRKLGQLRDVHVMQEWIHQLDTPDDPVTGALLQFVGASEVQLQQEALEALEKFDRKKWARWCDSLPRRMARLRQGSLVFRHLALEKWTEAHKLHLQVMRRPSVAGFHRIRIGLKRFRYIVENFLPLQHDAWIDDLKKVQDLLGDVHDLDVLWEITAPVGVIPDAETRSRWQKRIQDERLKRIDAYTEKMTGEDSLWQVWRAELPSGKEIRSGALLRLKLWASVLDPDFKHSTHVTQLTLQIYDGLTAHGVGLRTQERTRTILGLAALLHEVGLSKDEKGHHKTSFRMVRDMAPPLGLRKQDLLAAGIVARYHRGALPAARQKTLMGLSAAQRKEIVSLAAILRLGNAFDAARDGHIRALKVNGQNGFLQITAQGYSSRDRTAEAIAAARHLLETVYRCPVIVKPMRVARRKAAGNQARDGRKTATQTADKARSAGASS